MSQAALNKCNRYKKEKNSERSNKERLAGILFLLSILLSMFISAWMMLNWMKDTERLPLSKLLVTGERYYTHTDDIRQLILALGSPGTFMTQNVNVIQSQIKRLPWIKLVHVRKQWPDKLKVHLVEYVPIARWNDQYMVDIDGHSFRVPSEREHREDLPKLYGPEDSDHEVLQNFRKMEQVLIKRHFTLKDAAMTARRSWQVTLSNGIKLHLGRGDTMNRLLRFIELYPVLHQAETNGKWISYVDLRYDSGAAVGWETDPINGLNQKQTLSQVQAVKQ